MCTLKAKKHYYVSKNKYYSSITGGLPMKTALELAEAATAAMDISAVTVNDIDLTVAPRIELFNGNILVQQLKDMSEKTESGILWKPQSGAVIDKYVVVAVAADVTEVAVGDNIVIDRFTGNEQTIFGTKYFVCKTDDLLLKFRN